MELENLKKKYLSSTNTWRGDWLNEDQVKEEVNWMLLLVPRFRKIADPKCSKKSHFSHVKQHYSMENYKNAFYAI